MPTRRQNAQTHPAPSACRCPVAASHNRRRDRLPFAPFSMIHPPSSSQPCQVITVQPKRGSAKNVAQRPPPPPDAPTAATPRPKRSNAQVVIILCHCTAGRCARAPGPRRRRRQPRTPRPGDTRHGTYAANRTYAPPPACCGLRPPPSWPLPAGLRLGRARAKVGQSRRRDVVSDGMVEAGC